MAREFKLRRGLKNVFVAEVTNDDNTTTGYTTGTPYHLIPAGEMTRTPSSESTNTWFDDVVFASVGTEGATEIKISGASLRAAAAANLLGKEVDATTGAVLDSGEYVEKYWALLGEAEGVDGSSEYFCFLKGTFTAPEESDKTKDDSTDANGMELTFNAIQTTHVFTATNKVCKRVVIDSTTTAIKTDQSWTAQVVTPDNISTICEKIV
jgi:phi13 family phage major tail protein